MDSALPEDPVDMVSVFRHKLEKYVKLGENEKILSYLRKLKHYPVTLEILQETGVGKTVNGLRKHDGQIGERARNLVNKWKTLVVVDEDEGSQNQLVASLNHDDDDDESHGDDRQDAGVHIHETFVEESSIKNCTQEREKVSQPSIWVKPDPDSEPEPELDLKPGTFEPEMSLKTTPIPDPAREKEPGTEMKPELRREPENETEPELVPEREMIGSEIDTGGELPGEASDALGSPDKKSKKRKKKSKDKDKDRAKEETGQTKDREKERSRKRDEERDMEKSKEREKKEREKLKNREREEKEKKDRERSRDKEKERRGREKDREKEKPKDDCRNDKKKRRLEHSPSPKPKQSSSERKLVECDIFAFASGSASSASSRSPKKKQKLEKKEEKIERKMDFLDDAAVAKLSSPALPTAPELIPDISPDYVPKRLPPPTAVDSPVTNGGSKKATTSQASAIAAMSEEEALSWAMSNKTKKTKIYSGTKSMAPGVVPKLEALCIKFLCENIKELPKMAVIVGMPIEIVKPVLFKCNAEQLFHLEDLNPSWIEDTGPYWEQLVKRDFKSEKRLDCECWREMYMRCKDEREVKFRRLAASIQRNATSEQSSLKKTKLAYVDVPAKPLQKRRHGHHSSSGSSNGSRPSSRGPSSTGSSSGGSSFSKVDLAASASRASILQNAVGPSGSATVAVPTSGRVSQVNGRSPGAAAAVPPKKPKVAPLMQKTLQLLKRRYR